MACCATHNQTESYLLTFSMTCKRNPLCASMRLVHENNGKQKSCCLIFSKRDTSDANAIPHCGFAVKLVAEFYCAMKTIMCNITYNKKNNRCKKTDPASRYFLQENLKQVCLLFPFLFICAVRNPVTFEGLHLLALC